MTIYMTMVMTMYEYIKRQQIDDRLIDDVAGNLHEKGRKLILTM